MTETNYDDDDDGGGDKDDDDDDNEYKGAAGCDLGTAVYF